MALCATLWSAGIEADTADTVPQATAEGLELGLSVAKTALVAGENVEIVLTLKNIGPTPVRATALQPFMYLNPHIEADGKVLPQQVFPHVAVLEPPLVLQPKQSVQRVVDLATWYPIGLYAGEFAMRFEHRQVLGGRQLFSLRSNTISLKVAARDEREEAAFKAYLALQDGGREHAHERYREFIEKHAGSIFEARARLDYVCAIDENVTNLEVARGVLGADFEKTNPTRYEGLKARWLLAWLLTRADRLEEAISVLKGLDDLGYSAERKRMQQIVVANRGQRGE
jgi:hypothetical protein